MLLRHDRCGSARHQPRAVLIHAGDALEVFEARVEVVDVVVERGIVHEDVDRAERLHRFIDTLLRGIGIGDVGLHEDRLTFAFERLHGTLGAFFHHLGHDDLGPFGEKPLGVGETNPLAGTGDDRDFVLETAHKNVFTPLAYFFRRAMRLNRSVTTGSPPLVSGEDASDHTVSMTTNVMRAESVSFS